MNMILKKLAPKRFTGFTLAELIVVVTILAVLASIGFLAVSGYSKDASDARAKANARSAYSAITSESALTGNSPRYYVVHDAGAALSWWIVFFNWSPSVLTGGQYGTPGTNYSAWNPDWPKLKLNPEKFRISAVTKRLLSVLSLADAAFDPRQVLVGAADLSTFSAGKSRKIWYVQAAAIPDSGMAFVVWNYPPGLSGSVAGLLKNPSSASLTGALVDGLTISVPSVPMGENSWSTGTWWTCSGETGTWWYSSWSACSATCGGGTQTRTATCTRNGNGSQSRTVQCLKHDGTILSDADCLETKPAVTQSCSQESDSVCGSIGTTNQSCNTGTCPTNWACSTTAGTCTAGTVSWDNGATACGTTRTWSCLGLNWGTTANCSKANAACALGTWQAPAWWQCDATIAGYTTACPAWAVYGSSCSPVGSQCFYEIGWHPACPDQWSTLIQNLRCQ